MSSNQEKLYRAVNVLVGSGPIQERLANAYRDQLRYLDRGELTDMGMVEVERIRDQLTKVDASGEADEIDMSARDLSDSQAEELAIEILDMYEQSLRRART